MKYWVCVSAAMFSFSVMVGAQGLEDALRFNQNNVFGTARSQAMGGAFGAVGADLTSMAINPAGMGLYRATETALTLGVNAINNETNYWSNKESETKIKVPFNQLGINFSSGLMRDKAQGLVCSNFFIGYNRLADFNSTQIYSDPISFNSILDYFCFDEQLNASMTGVLAYDAYLTNDTTLSDGSKLRYNVWEEIVGDVVNPYFRADLDGVGLVGIKRKVKTSGSKGDLAFGYAANVSNVFYIGGSINIQTFTYDEVVSHNEVFDSFPLYDSDPVEFSYNSTVKQDGVGCCFKLGVLFRPINMLRLGFAIHSPSFDKITEVFYSSIYLPEFDEVTRTETFEYEYRFQSPSRFVASAAVILGQAGLVSLDYERTNHKYSKFKQIDDANDIYEPMDTYDDINKLMKNEMLKASNTIRIGAELSILNPLYLRAGMRYTSSALNEDFYRVQPKDYSLSGGIGLRLNNFFADLSYVCTVNETDSWVLPNSAFEYYYDKNISAKRTQKARNAVITIGFRF